MKRTALTLIEVVVALALGVLLVTSVQVLTVRAHQTARNLKQEITLSQRRGGWLDLLRADLGNMSSSGNLALRDNELQIITLNDLEPTSTRTRSTIAVRYQRSDQGELLRAQRKTSEEEWPHGAALMQGLRTVVFEIFDGRQWQTEWPQAHLSRRASALRTLLTFENQPPLEALIPLTPLRWSRHGD